MKINDNFRLLPKNYLFSEVAARIADFRQKNPGVEIIRMDIGDVTLPLPPVCVEAMHKAVDDFRSSGSFHGYGPEQGYAFLREAIAAADYQTRGIDIKADEIFVSDGAKSDLGNLGDLLAPDAKVALCNPGYPVYADSNVIDGRGGTPEEDGFSDFIYLDCTPANGFKPSLPGKPADVVYLCYPNNPTGTTLTREELVKWVEYARAHGMLIIYDSAYEAFIRDESIPRSIYEIPGATEVAIEVRSFSKTAGFTGLRLGYTVVPEALKAVFADGSEASLRDMWRRRQTTKFNGASYIIQRGAEALYSEEGRRQLKDNIDIYLHNAGILREALAGAGFAITGGENSPYVWAKGEGDADSWDLFSTLLSEAHVSSTPGSGFGSCGKGCLRFTGFNSTPNTIKAAEAIAASHILK